MTTLIRRHGQSADHYAHDADSVRSICGVHLGDLPPNHQDIDRRGHLAVAETFDEMKLCKMCQRLSLAKRARAGFKAALKPKRCVYCDWDGPCICRG